MPQSWINPLRREPAAAAALAIFVVSAATLLGAWYFEYVVKLPPRPLCLEQRLRYHIVVPLSLFVAIAALVQAPRALITVGLLAIMAAMLCGAAVAATSPDGTANPFECLRLWALVHGIAKLIVEHCVKPADYGLSSSEKLATRLLRRGQ
jgi:disulfide bond formation protein DsbB